MDQRKKKIKVLVTRKFPEIGIQMLEREGFDLSCWQKDRTMSPEELISMAQGHQALFCTLTEKIDAAFIAATPQLEIISQFAVGYDNIDVQAATRADIPVGFTPDAMSRATADIAFGLMIASARKMFFLNRQILQGGWGTFNPVGHLGLELEGKTLGLFGMGRIGMKMAQRCQGAFDMEVIYHNRSRNREAEQQFNARWVDFDTLLKSSDVLSVHSVLSPETRGRFDAQAFALMKPSAIFINSARGPSTMRRICYRPWNRGRSGGPAWM